MTIILLLALSYLIGTANAGCGWGVTHKWECPWEDAAEYNGPPGEIVDGKPSLPSDVSFDESAEMDVILDVVSGAIGSIPDVGSVLSLFFEAFQTIFGQASTNNALEEFYNALKGEVDAIIEYVDAKVLELQIDDIKKTLGGLLASAQDCQESYINPEDIKICLIAVRQDIINQEKFFLPYVPSNPTSDQCIEQGPMLEQLIPMWRHYCDLRLAVTIELITAYRHLGQEEEAQVFIEDIPEEVRMFTDWWYDVFPLLKFYSAAIHDVDTYEHNSCELYEGSICLFSVHTYDLGLCVAEFGPSGSSLNCYIEELIGCKNTDSWTKSFHKAYDSFMDHINGWLNARVREVDRYYNAQVERTVAHWVNMANKIRTGKRQQLR